MQNIVARFTENRQIAYSTVRKVAVIDVMNMNGAVYPETDLASLPNLREFQLSQIGPVLRVDIGQINFLSLCHKKPCWTQVTRQGLG